MARQPRMRSSPEFDLIGRIRERLGAAGGRDAPLGIGDDAAVTTPAGATATSVDALVEGIHFRSAWTPPRAVGHKAMAVALSDLAAMGARPGEAYVWLGRPPELGEEATLELCDGLAAVAAEAGVAVLGGDLTASPQLALAVTVVGHAPEADSFVGRDGAAAGDAICLTGEIGGAAAGLALLEAPELADGIEMEVAERLRERTLYPRPRLGAGLALAECGARALIDLSDGLGADAEHVAAASGVGLDLDAERIPLQEGVAAVASAAGRDPLELALGGEDYELLCALPVARVEQAGERLAGERGLTVLGEAGAGTGVRISYPDGRRVPTGGHDHLRH